MPNAFQYHQNLYILDDPIAYRREIVKYLELIRTTHAGRTLLKFIYLRARRLLIMPYVPSKETYGAINAYADADDWNGAYTKNAPQMTGYDIPGYGTIMLPNGTFGTGTGTTVHLKYHPAIFRQLAKNRGFIAPGDGPGEVLFHEMVHAMRMIHGKFLRTTVTEDLHMDDFEEFCAILGANIYRSERGFKLMRTNHAGSEALPKELNDSQAYAIHFQDEIERWFNSQRDFCVELASSTAQFNPLKFVAAGMGLPVRTPMAL